IAKKRGLLSVLSLTINIILFSIAIKLYNTGINLFELCSILAVVFTIITLLILNGINKRTFAAICSTLLTLLFTILIFLGASKVGEPLDYSVLDYIYATDDLEYIFFSGVLLAGLGAVMDVSVSITSAMNELVVKNPSISLVDMFKSSREISHDIMGAMINVLLFTYICGLLPMFIIKLKNDVRFITLITLQIPFEISRFLTGSIAILLAVPISIIFSILFLKVRKEHQ
ncbi:MAG: YibE/F family protein, partial [Lachnospiraceae bacterium]|nr:YibE/F family protein [Lachnospiraceae bacterium]